MLKYVRFSHPQQLDNFVFCGALLTHAKLAEPFVAEGYKPVSAGFVDFGPAGNVTTHGDSIGLKLKPQEDDARMIYALYVHTRPILPIAPSPLPHPPFVNASS